MDKGDFQQHEQQQRILKVENSNNLGIGTFDISQNYSILLSKLEKLALGVGEISEQDRNNKNDINIIGSGASSSSSSASDVISSSNINTILNRNNIDQAEEGFLHHLDLQLHPHNGMSEAEYSRFISDVWIGIVLTLLILSIIFFICSCFLYHKFQQWKNSYRTNATDQPNVIRRYDLDMESLPSYTLVSGLPSYDDALEQFRKAGIIISPHPSVIKIFEDPKQKIVTSSSDILVDGQNSGFGDNISINSCTCGAIPPTSGHASGTSTPITINAATTSTINYQNGLSASTVSSSTGPAIIELNPEHLKILGQKRLSLQIAVDQPAILHRPSHSRIDLYREVNRSNLLRSHDVPQIHRSTSSLSFERNFLARRLHLSQHRGSLS